MKILFFHRWTGVHLGGTETHVRELMERFVERGHEVSLLTRCGEYPKDIDPKIKIYRISKNPFESNHSYETPLLLYAHTAWFMTKSFFYLLYLRFIKGQKFDVISVHFATESLVCQLFRLLFGTPYVFILEGYTKLEADVAKLANAAVAISRHEVNDTFKYHGYKPLYIPKGKNPHFNTDVDGSDVRREYLKGAEKLLIAVGRIESRKDYPTLVAAAKYALAKGKKYRWLIAGDGIDFQKIQNLIESENMTETVVMLGPVRNEDLPKFYRASDLFVLPTLYEGFGFVFVEAMACGLPVVSTTAGAVPEVVNGAGILVEPKCPEKFADAAIKILEDENLRREFSQKAIENAKYYDWERLIVEYENAYRSAVH